MNDVDEGLRFVSWHLTASKFGTVWCMSMNTQPVA